MKATTKIISGLFALFFMLMITSCEKDSEGISEIAYFPVIKLTGNPFINIKTQASGPYVDPGVKAFFMGKEISFKTTGTVDATKPGFYKVTYSAQEPSAKFPEVISITRSVLVTDNLITTDPYSGGYKVVSATKTTEMSVTMIAPGVYKASDTWWQTSKIPVIFVDLGTGLMLLDGDSGYGSYSGIVKWDSAAKTLYFEIKFTEGVNLNYVYKTTWKKN